MAEQTRTLTAVQQLEWELDQEYALYMDTTPRFGTVRALTQPAVMAMLMNREALQRVHIEALRRISASMGHPLKDAPDRSALTLSDLAVAQIRMSRGEGTPA